MLLDFPANTFLKVNQSVWICLGKPQRLLDKYEEIYIKIHNKTVCLTLLSSFPLNKFTPKVQLMNRNTLLMLKIINQH